MYLVYLAMSPPSTYAVADPGGGELGGLTPEFFLACQYMKIPADLDPNPPPLKNSGPEQPPPLEEFLGPPLRMPYFV